MHQSFIQSRSQPFVLEGLDSWVTGVHVFPSPNHVVSVGCVVVFGLPVCAGSEFDA